MSDMADVLVTQFRKCLTTNLVVRLNNFTLWRVSTSKVKVAPKEFLSGKQYSIIYYVYDVENLIISIGSLLGISE